jgi:iron complex transport system ATP-binding protein
VIKIKKLCGGYGKRQIITDINAEFKEGIITTLVGVNGCGKSTLLQHCAGLLKPFSGDIFVGKADISRIKRIELAKEISYLPQTRTAGSITVRSFVSHGRFPYLGYPRRYGKTDKEKIDYAMKLADVSELSEKMVSELSGGQQQKVYIAMLLAQDTDIILLDEPVTYLDIIHQLELMELIKRLKSMGKTIVMVLHDLNFALTYSDMVYVMENGRIIENGTPQRIIESNIFKKAFGVETIYEPESGQYFFRKCEVK